MKTAQEILIESKTQRLREEEEAKRWASIVRDCRSWLFLDFTALMVWPVVMAVLIYGESTRPFMRFYGLAILFWLSTAIRLVVSHRRRERGIREAVRLYAPELYSRLQREKIA